jgi:hypothetical protein
VSFETHQIIRFALAAAALAGAIGFLAALYVQHGKDASYRPYVTGFLLIGIAAAISLAGKVARWNEAITFTPEGTVASTLALIGVVIIVRHWRKRKRPSSGAA